ncbi:MAG: hypothetical protein AAGH68_15785 [Pseudomonadota bacterium]
MNIRKRVLFAAGALAIGLAGCYQVPQSTAASYEKGSLSVVDQAAGGAITVAQVGMPSTGWVVVHAVRGGEPDFTGSIGHLYVPAGPSSNVSVPLDAPLASGSEAVVMLHLDTGNAKVFEFANGGNEKVDGPVLKDGKPVMQKISLR